MTRRARRSRAWVMLASPLGASGMVVRFHVRREAVHRCDELCVGFGGWVLGGDGDSFLSGLDPPDVWDGFGDGDGCVLDDGSDAADLGGAGDARDHAGDQDEVLIGKNRVGRRPALTPSSVHPGRTPRQVCASGVT